MVERGPMDAIIFRKMGPLIGSLWLYITNSLVFLFTFITTIVFRTKREEKYETDASSFMETKEFEFKDKYYDACMEKETSGFSFKFQYQTSDYSLRRDGEAEIPAMISNNSSSTNTSINKYHFLCERDISGFMEEPETMTFRIHDSLVHPNTDDISGDLESRCLSANDLCRPRDEGLLEEACSNSDTGSSRMLNKREESEGVKLLETNIIREKANWFVPSEFSGFDSDSELSISDGYSVKEIQIDSDSDGFLSEKDLGEHEHESCTTGTSSNKYTIELLQDVRKLEEAQLQSLSNSDTESSDVIGLPSSIVNQINYDEIFMGFLSDSSSYDPESKLVGSLEELERNKQETLQYFHSFDAGISCLSAEKSGSEDKKQPIDTFEVVWSDNESCEPELVLKDLVGEVELLEVCKSIGNQSQSLSTCDVESMDDGDDGLFSLKNENFDSKGLEEVIAVKDIDKGDSEKIELAHKQEVLKDERKEGEKDLEKSKETNVRNLDAEELDELESLWEHQDLIEQLKMELKKAKAFGLPTILEESETPKTMDDLKPWKIDEKFLHEDPMDELHKFYKSYRERMRKFDILNYQKMYAMGFLQLKDPIRSLGLRKAPKITSLLFQNFWLFRRCSFSNDPSEMFIKELQSDLETVYVGQMCLSWEFLRWQYEKARELPECEPHRRHQYNQVAGEFQQFQVIVQRFIENESFQGPRLLNYVKSRCVLRNLLQVPVIREDCWKDKMEERKKGNDAITAEMLENIMEESIRLFWEFVKADKDETPVILTGLMTTKVELQDPSDFELMVDIKQILLKKEKKLKDILRTGNCIVRKFKKPQEDRSNQDIFFSQVDLKLVARVLKMSRITSDQLVWCHKKLKKISFIDRKIEREPSFLLFPC